MRIKSLLFFLITFIGYFAQAQNTINFVFKDATNQELLIGATVQLQNSTIGTASDDKGEAILTNIPNGNQIFEYNFIGYSTQTQTFLFPLPQDTAIIVLLQPEGEEAGEIIVEATRANRSIEDIPTRVEVLTEEIEEAAIMDPSKIAHLITHSTGIQVQTTGATSNTANVRIQGLDGKYTQILRDGFPIYGGFSGSLSITQIAPLDLRQIEYIKGSASTLYGGGAIAGLINLLSKEPTADEVMLHLNYSNIGARDANVFASKRFGKFGVTVLSNFNLHKAYDADKDGFSDLPELQKFTINPKLYYYADSSLKIYGGATITRENRAGGHMNLLQNANLDSANYYKESNNIARTTTQFKLDKRWGEHHSFTVKNSFNFFNRSLFINENQSFSQVKFSGKQVASFSEIAYQFNNKLHNLTTGVNFVSDNFNEQKLQADTLRNEQHLTTGFFANHLWNINEKIALENGLRVDYNVNKSLLSQSKGNVHVLPRINALFKWNSKLRSRIGGGLGYRTPTLFSQEAEIMGFKQVHRLDFANLKNEQSYGGNVDITYRTALSSKVSISLNQLFFYSYINNPIVFSPAGNGFTFINANGNINTKGFETQMKLFFGDFVWFVGYTYTDARQSYNSNKEVPLTPRHSVKGDILYVVPAKWRIGVDYEYKSPQTLTNGFVTKSQFMTGVVIERTIENFVLFFNAENVTDVRQTRYGSIISNPYGTPQYTEIYAPLDGLFLNFGFKIKVL